MSKQHKILIIGRHADMLEKVKAMVSQQGYEVFGSMTNQGAFEIFELENIDAVIIGGGVDTESRQLFHSEFSKLNAGVKIIDAHPQTVLEDLRNAFSSEN